MRVRKLILGVVLAALAVAGTAAQDEGVRIGVVDLDQALNSTEEGKAAREEMARKQREAEASVQPMMERFRDLQEELKSKKFVLSDEALYQKQLDLVELKNQVDSQLKELDGKLKVDQERLVAPLRKKLIEIVESIGRDQGFTMIVERGTPGLLYSREALDITDMVIKRFNSKG
jgi:outer membrane protein